MLALPVILYALAVLTTPVVSQGDPIKGICNNIKNVFGCTAKLDLPTGAEAKMCPNKSFEVAIQSNFIVHF